MRRLQHGLRCLQYEFLKIREPKTGGSCSKDSHKKQNQPSVETSRLEIPRGHLLGSVFSGAQFIPAEVLEKLEIPHCKGICRQMLFSLMERPELMHPFY